MDVDGGTWSGLDAALHELGMLSTVTESRKEYLREKLERLRHEETPTSPFTLGRAGSCRSLDRPLQPSQAWNLCSSATEDEADSTMWNSCLNRDSENSENSYNSWGGKAGKTSDRVKPVAHPQPIPLRLGAGGGFNVLHMNTQYITGVDVGNEAGYKRPYCMQQIRPTMQHRQHHLKPYEIPWRRDERVRTRSENADVDANVDHASTATVVVSVPSTCTVMDDDILQKGIQKLESGGLYKSRSLENIHVSCLKDAILHSTHEMESMSKRIQRLHVNE